MTIRSGGRPRDRSQAHPAERGTYDESWQPRYEPEHRLDGELAPLRSQWVGEAQQAYTVAKARWDGAINEMRDLLRITSQQVTQANADYRAADARGARSFGG